MRNPRNLLKFAFVTLCALGLAFPASAATFKWANGGDVRDMDPYTLDVTFQTAFLNNIYEALVRRTADLKIEPALAESWEALSPTVMRFHLRPNVRFHDGTTLKADDVVFSFGRITSKTSNKSAQVAGVKEIRKIDDLTVDVETRQPDPILLSELYNMVIMSKEWCEKNNSVAPAVVGSSDNYALHNAMGTGPFKLVSREPDRLTVLEKNPDWWDKPVHNIDRVEFNVIANPATRVAALLSGEVDMIYTVPTQDMERIQKTPGFKLETVPEIRTIYLGFDQKRDELLKSNVKGKNPFKDVRVRKAFALAIDENAIAARIMRGQARPTWIMWGPGVNGYNPELDKRPPPDLEQSKKLLAEAGYPKGFQVTLDCPNDRYVNDAAICTAVSAMLARVGIKVDVDARTQATFFADVLAPNFKTGFFLLGWAPTTYDAHTALAINFSTRGANGLGLANVGGYSNPRIDKLTEAIGQELDQTKRNSMIDEAAKIIQDEVAILPLHQQVVVWAMKDNLDIPQPADNMLSLRLVTMK